MQPFTLDQAIITGMLFVLGILIGMFFLAGGKWKRRYRDEVVRRQALETEVEQLRRDGREMESLRHAASRNPAPAADRLTTTSEPYRRVDTDDDGHPDTVIRQP